MSRTSALLWLALVFGSAVEPARSETPLAAPIEEVRKHLRGGKIDSAIEAGEQAVATLAQDSRAWFWLGRAYAQQAIRASLLGKPKWAGKTRDAYEKSVTLDPANLEARFDLMQYYLAAPGFLGGGRDKADAQAAAITERDAVMGKLAAAFLANRDEQPAQAERHLREALALDPSSSRVRVNLSMQMQGDKRWAEIRALWAEALTLRPDDAMAHYQLGRLAAVSGEQLDAGLTHLLAYLAKPEGVDGVTPASAHWRRGQILEKLGRREEAIAAMEESLRLEADVAHVEADLDRLRDA